VPAWLDRVAQFGWRILVIVGLTALAVAVAAVLPMLVLPLVVAIILTASLDPAVAWLVSRGHGRGRAAAIALGGGALGVVLVLVAAALALVGSASELAGTVDRGMGALDSASSGLLGLPSSAVTEGGREVVGAILSLADAAAGLVVMVGLGCLVAFYFLRDGAILWDRATGRLPRPASADLHAVGARAMAVLGGYMVGTAAISFVGAASQLVIMVVLGLPMVMPVFVLSFILGFIPYIGGFISTGIAFLITVAVGSTADVLVMAAWTVLFNIVAGNVVSPLVYSRTVHLHPAIVLLAIPAGSAIAGMMGMFLAVPALGVVAATWRTVLSILSRPRRTGDAPVDVADDLRAAPGAVVQPAGEPLPS
jgi:predicted PurR-regulated permease PerM